MSKMKLWVISQDEKGGYDTYDSAVVAAETEEEARRIVPGEYGHYGADGLLRHNHEPKAVDEWPSWAPHLKRVKAEYIGEAKDGTKAGVIVASFNAG